MKTGDAIAEEYIDNVPDEDIEYEKNIEWVDGVPYNINKANKETIRICLENEKKTPREIPDDPDYFKKLFGFA